jgi:hypothetical protein
MIFASIPPPLSQSVLPDIQFSYVSATFPMRIYPAADRVPGTPSRNFCRWSRLNTTFAVPPSSLDRVPLAS